MIDIITFLDNNVKSAVYKGGNIHGLYCYLYIIGYPTTLTTSGQHSHHFGPSYSINSYRASLHPVVAAPCMVHFLFNALIEFKEQNQLEYNGIDSGPLTNL